MVVFMMILIGCTQPKVDETQEQIAYLENYEIIGEEREDRIGYVPDQIFVEVDRSNEGATEFVISPSREQGELFSLPEGRYIIFPEYAGNLFIRDETGEIIYQEFIGSFMGVAQVTFDIHENYTIEVDQGVTFAYLNPVETVISNELSAGMWRVGSDIAPGQYELDEYFGYGYLQILKETGEHHVFELVSSINSETTPLFDLADGDVIIVSGISLIPLKPL